MSIFLELINLYFIVPRVPCRQGWGFLDWSQKQHYEKGTFSTIALVDCPCWQHGLAFTVGKFLTVIFCSAGRMPQLFRVWNLWLLSNLCMTVSLRVCMLLGFQSLVHSCWGIIGRLPQLLHEASLERQLDSVLVTENIAEISTKNFQQNYFSVLPV